ncbi:MAG: hypothetical protein ABSH20_28005 [Tepidisphaeraceae bacterium]|jgi:hypothetical protein
MGYDLSNAAGDFHEWKVLGWWSVLNLARAYGWIPCGTHAPAGTTDASPWDGNYFMNDGQRVLASDALSLADALDRLLEDSQKEVVAGRLRDRMQELVDAPSVPEPDSPTDVMVYPLAFIRGMLQQFGQTSIGAWSFTDKGNAYLREFIAFCRKGEFAIG